MDQHQALRGDPAPVPEVIASYAAYLRIRTRAEPQITARAASAEVSVAAGGKTLVLAFRYSKKWALRSAGLRHGAQTVTFSRGELAEAMAALLRP